MVTSDPSVFTLLFPQAVGTGIIVSSQRSDFSRFPALFGQLSTLIEDFESTFSRFRSDSLINTAAAHDIDGGPFEISFPSYAADLFDLYDALFQATSGKVTPTIADALIRLGYGQSYNSTHASSSQYSSHRSSQWGTDVWHTGATLHFRRPAHLDFGAAGKGFLVDLMADILVQNVDNFTINAGGDIYTTEELTIALENPYDTSQAVGVVHVTEPSALCASAPNRRHWTTADTHEEVHHLLDGLTGQSVHTVLASWSLMPTAATRFPTAWADILSTALFVSSPDQLVSAAPHGWQCARMSDMKNAQQSVDWPGEFFTR
ncbi:FAD:protein FMN transferase [Alloscardovia venturai]|uniref:FAD:protein FMN transferase n=1 Tax=Alloscardovia venturai TaxID=1769421 RepID=A0ABW2Y4G8_9BIFI